MEIRQLDEHDLGKVLRLDKNVFPGFSESKEVVLDRLKVFPEGCFGAFSGKGLAGYITAEIWLRHHEIRLNVKASAHHDPKGTILYVTSLAVIPNMQSKGIGTALMKKIIESAVKRKLMSIYIRTHSARKFYEKVGFGFVRHADDDDGSYDIVEMML